MSFVPDLRNKGGKQQVMDKMSNHYSKLSNMKSSIDTKPPRPHVNSIGKKPTGVNKFWELNEVKEGFRRAAVVKSYIDN